jgi:hypothetical protein
MNPKLLVATTKGLVVIGKHENSWRIDAVHFAGMPVSFIYVDGRSNTWWAAISHRHWGEKLHSSKDQGGSWTETALPSYKGYIDRADKPATLKKLWVMEQAGLDKPGCLWLGTEPGGLFYSDNGGATWTINEPLWNHPSRQDKTQWFGAGKDFPFIHSIIVDPQNSQTVYIGVSCAGVFKTTDGGKSWSAKNNGLVATYLPNPKTEVGHDPHRMLLCSSDPNVIWQQNHCGIFRTNDGAENWKDVSGKEGFPFYGFALAIDDESPDIAWVIPAQSDEVRLPHELKLAVCKTIDGGKSWATFRSGLPASNSFDLVLRHALARSGRTLAFGTNNGNLFVSEDRGETWTTITHHLAVINCVVFA